MGIINQNAFMAADHIILVSDVSKKSIQGAQQFTYLWGEVCENMDVEDKTSALILNNCDKRIGLTQSIKEYYQDDEDFGKIVLDGTIPARVDIKNTETELKEIPEKLFFRELPKFFGNFFGKPRWTKKKIAVKEIGS